MRTEAIASNPFALIMAPELVREAMERSESLRSLRLTQFHPLDNPRPMTASVELSRYEPHEHVVTVPQLDDIVLDVESIRFLYN